MVAYHCYLLPSESLRLIWDFVTPDSLQKFQRAAIIVLPQRLALAVGCRGVLQEDSGPKRSFGANDSHSIAKHLRRGTALAEAPSQPWHANIARTATQRGLCRRLAPALQLSRTSESQQMQARHFRSPVFQRRPIHGAIQVGARPWSRHTP